MPSVLRGAKRAALPEEAAEARELSAVLLQGRAGSRQEAGREAPVPVEEERKPEGPDRARGGEAGDPLPVQGEAEGPPEGLEGDKEPGFLS